MTDHAFLAPSSAHLWGPDGCPYYPTMAASCPPQEDTLEKRQGTAAHHLLAQRLWGVVVEVGALAPNGEPITAEMFEGTDDFVEAVEKLRAEYPDLEERVEERVHMPQIHPTSNWGTADWFAWSPSSNRIWVKDFKYGHLYVDAWENYQLLDYALGALNHFKQVLTADKSFNLSIYQPRSYSEDGPVKHWPCDAVRMNELMLALMAAAQMAMGLDPQMASGDHCTFCEGKTKCPAFIQSVQNGIDVSLQGEPHEMDPAARGTFRTQIEAARDRLKGMATGLDADIEADLRKGTATPGWELKPGNPRLAWTASQPELVALSRMVDVPIFKEATLDDATIYYDPITPTKAIEKGIDATVIMEYAKRPPAGLKVVQSEKSSAAKAFK